MRILYIAPKAPFPIVDGGCFAMAQFIHALQPLGEIEALVIETSKHPVNQETKSHFESIRIPLHTCSLDTRVKPIPALFSLLKGDNYNVTRFRSVALKLKLQELLRKSFDVIVCDGLFAAAEIQIIRSLFAGKIILRSHNIESAIWKELAENEPKALKRWYLKSLSSSLKTEEQNIIQQTDEVWCLSQEDQTNFKKQFPEKPIQYLPIAVAVPTQQADYKINTCFHLGAMNWKPNVASVSFLVNEIWGKSQQTLPDLLIAGSFSEELTIPARSNVRVVGKVDDISSFLLKAGILVTPIQSGSGVRVKLLEAMAHGVPCISTNHGAQGIHIEEAGIVIAESASEFKAAIQSLSDSEEKRRIHGDKSVQYIQKYHSFAVNTSLIQQFLES